MTVLPRAFVRACIPLGAAGIIVACDPPPPEASAPPAQREAAAPSDVVEPKAETRATAAAPSVAGDANPARSSLAIDLYEVRRQGATVEIEVALDRPLPPMGSMRPSLRVGGETTQRSLPGTDGRLDRLVFLVDAEQFERMPADGELVVRAGMLSNETALARPRLSDVPVKLVGGAP